MPRAVFNKLNEERIKSENPPFANPRNAAAGTLKLLDPKIVASRSLDAFSTFSFPKIFLQDNHFDNLKKASEWGFKVPDSLKLCSNIDEVLEFISHWEYRTKKSSF